MSLIDSVSISRTLLFGSLFLILPTSAEASEPHWSVSFDTPRTAICKKVGQSSHSKTILVEFNFSIKMDTGDEKDMDSVSIEITCPPPLLVRDFLPKTKSTTDVVGGKKRIITTETNSKDLELAISGAGSTKLNLSNLEKVETTYEQLAPRELLNASGIRNRGHGVFFKMKPTSQHVIEGQHKFVCLFEVDQDWRCDFIQAKCDPSFKYGTASRKDFTIGLYMAGDQDGKSAIEKAQHAYSQIAASESRLKTTKSKLWYPWFGLGSKAASIEKEISKLKEDHASSLKNIDNVNSRREEN